MHLFSTKTNNKHIIINLLFSSLVISFIAGNLVLNLNIALFIVFSFFFFKKEIYKYIFLDKKKIGKYPRYIKLKKIGKSEISELSNFNKIKKTINKVLF